MIKTIEMIFDEDYYEIHCDSCHGHIATCKDFEFEDDQELIYSPILCEKCGAESSKFMGEMVKEVGEIVKNAKVLEKVLNYNEQRT